MCGIAGMAGISDRWLLREMLARTQHRGPNDTGIYLTDQDSQSERIALGNNRLSILDLSQAGHQPMSNEDGTVWVVYNGEIYNFGELREELIRRGHHLHSHTDSEILPHLYEEYGASLVNYLNGMFAFAVWDDRKQELLIFRDKMGIKPLYYAQAGQHLYFASEIKALLACPEVRAGIDLQSVDQYCAFLYVPGPQTMFRGISKLMPGHMLTWKQGKVKTRCYWDVKYGPYVEESGAQLAEEFRGVLKNAVRRQLISDVPLGFFLSGGLDSSSLLACAAENSSRLRCYCIAYPQGAGALEQCSEDVTYARKVARHFGAELVELTVEANVADLLPKIVWHLDDPVADPAAISTYLICREAKSEVTVLLSGQGADEVLGGYRVHFAPALAKRVRRLPGFVRNFLSSSLLPWVHRHPTLLPRISPGLVLAGVRHTQRVLHAADLSLSEQYISLRSYLNTKDLHSLLASDVREQLSHREYSFRFRDRFDECADELPLHQLLYVDSKTFLPDLNLAYSDKLSMACSIEARVPFLDDEVVSFLQKVPPGQKIHGTTQKYLLRRAMRGILPEGVLSRRKAAFGLPIRSWLKHELREMVGDLLSPDAIRRSNLFEPEAVERMVRANDEGTSDYTLQIWGLLSLQLWQQTFLEQSHPAELPAIQGLAGSRA
jgi:asparagine synthase (glutamine-hydrolysing)